MPLLRSPTAMGFALALLSTPALAQDDSPTDTTLSEIPVLGVIAREPLEPAQLAQIAVVLGHSVDDVTAWSPPPAPGPWWAAGLSPSFCAGIPAPDLDAALATARAALDELDGPRAIDALGRAQELLHCSTTPLEREKLAALLELRAQAALDEGDEASARASYRALHALAPEHRLSTPETTGYNALHREIGSALEAQPVGNLAIYYANQTDQSASVWLNGEAIPQGGHQLRGLRPGRHLLQWAADDSVASAWLTVPDSPGEMALVERSAAEQLLYEAPEGGAEQALTGWLAGLARGAGLAELAVVVDETELAGYHVNGRALELWSRREVPAHWFMRPERVRLHLGVGYANLAAFHYTRLGLGLDIQLAGPVHLTVGGDASVSLQELRVPDENGNNLFSGERAWLPGVEAGILIRRREGPVQPLGSLTGGAWFSVIDEELRAALRQIEDRPDQTLPPEIEQMVEGWQPVEPRIFLDGGVDLIPRGGLFVVRIAAGVGYGLRGPLARAGVRIGLRFVPPARQAGS